MLARTFLEQLRASNPGRVGLPRSASDVIRGIRASRVMKQATRLARFQHAWSKAVGSSIADNSEVRSYKHGELRVTVSSQALAHELSVYRAAEFVRAINEELGDKDRVATLTIRAGRISAPAERKTERNHGRE